MVEETIPIETSQTVLLSSPNSLQNSAEPTRAEGNNEDDSTNLQLTASANFEAPIQQDAPIYLLLTDNKSNLQEIPVEQKVSIGDSVTLSSEVDRSELHHKDVPDDLPSAYKIDESKNSPNDSTTPQSSSEECTNIAPESLVRSTKEVQATPSSNFQHGASDSDDQKVACEMPPAINMKVKEDKLQVVPRLHGRQMSLGDIRQKASVHMRRSNSGKCLGTDRSYVDTTTHIESVSAAASRFGGSVNWKAHRTQSMQESGHVVLELDRLKKEILECKQQAEAAEAAKLLVFNELERTRNRVEELKHSHERAQAEEAHAVEDLDFAEFMVKEMKEGFASDGSAAPKEQMKVIQERHEAVVTKLKSVKNEFRKLKEDYDSLIIEQDISIRKAQTTLVVSKESEKQVEELTVELNKLKEVLHLAHASCHDAEEHRIGMSLARDEDCLAWEKELKHAEDTMKQLHKRLSSVEDLKSKIETSSKLLLKLNAELATYMEAKPSEVAQEEGKKTHQSMQETAVSSRNELDELKNCIDKARDEVQARDEVRALKMATVSLKSELGKEKAALATMQQMEAMASITVSSLKVDIGLAQKELEVVQAKEKDSRDKVAELPKMLQDAVREADEAKSVATKAQEELRKTKEEVEQAKASLSTTDFRLRAILKEIEAAKESARLALDAVRASAETEHTVNIEEQDSPCMIALHLDEYKSLSEKSHQAEEHANERTATAIAHVEAAKESESHTLSRLGEIYKALEERKRALLAATDRADRATEGKLAMEQELRQWRAENGLRRKAEEAAKPEPKTSNTSAITVEHNGEASSMIKEDCYALVHPMSDTSVKSSPDDPALHVKKTNTKKLSFFARFMMFLARKRLKDVK